MQRPSPLITPILFAFFLLNSCTPPASSATYSISTNRVHLGTADDPEWDLFRNRRPDGPRLDLRFATPHLDESTLLIWQDDVKLNWGVELNGKRLGNLFAMEAPLVHRIPVPAGLLRSDHNTLSIIPPGARDDILVGEIQLEPSAASQAPDLALIQVDVSDAETLKNLPCRLTVLDQAGSLAPLQAPGGQQLALRPGVVYTGNGTARISLPPGDYSLYASRGFEYSLAHQSFSVSPKESKKLALNLRREVPTEGWVSCDTHTHTLTHSGHGDASVDERVLTLAGEGIELPVATDHNTHTDYTEASRRMGVSHWFTPVIGNEVTTRTAHFNVFPITPGSPPPNHRLASWEELMESIRGTPGVLVAILNHPHNTHNQFKPFDSAHFNPVLGSSRGILRFNYDAIELVNSSALQSDLFQVFDDWFAILNAGHRVTGVGSSDGHDVSRYIIGQGRTYIRANDADPSRIDVTEACQSLLAGRASVSLGLLPIMKVNERFQIGDLATNVGPTLQVEVSVLGPTWLEATRVELFANGMKIREHRITPSQPSRPIKAKINWTIPRPNQDIHLVCRATGPAVTNLHWAISRPYQPTSTTWEPRVIGCTNPIWIDADGDGRFTSPRAYARELTRNTTPQQLLPKLASYDQPTAAHAADFLQAQGTDLAASSFSRLLENAPPQVQRGFRSLP